MNLAIDSLGGIKAVMFDVYRWLRFGIDAVPLCEAPAVARRLGLYAEPR